LQKPFSKKGEKIRKKKKIKNSSVIEEKKIQNPTQKEQDLSST